MFRDGRSFSGFPEFRAHLTDNPETFTRTFARKLLTYATGRSLTIADRADVDAIATAAKNNDYSIRTMMNAVIESKLFHLP